MKKKKSAYDIIQEECYKGIFMKKTIFTIFLSGLWISISEFVRNEFIFKQYWIEHFHALGLNFETLPLNGILWCVWSFLMAYLLFELLQKFSFIKSIILAWIPAFVMMWIVIFNLQTLPLGLLIFAVPLSVLEVFIAGMIIKKITT
jgi:hypothetical protein